MSIVARKGMEAASTLPNNSLKPWEITRTFGPGRSPGSR